MKKLFLIGVFLIFSYSGYAFDLGIDNDLVSCRYIIGSNFDVCDSNSISDLVVGENQSFNNIYANLFNGTFVGDGSALTGVGSSYTNGTGLLLDGNEFIFNTDFDTDTTYTNGTGLFLDGNSFSANCEAITGSADLCDGIDNGGTSYTNGSGLLLDGNIFSFNSDFDTDTDTYNNMWIVENGNITSNSSINSGNVWVSILYQNGIKVVDENTAFVGDVTGDIGNTIVSDDSHLHTGSTISGLDISDDTNLGVVLGLSLSDDDLSILPSYFNSNYLNNTLCSAGQLYAWGTGCVNNNTFDTVNTYTDGTGIGLTAFEFSVTGGTCINADADGVSVTGNCIDDSLLTYDTGQHLGEADDVTHNSLVLVEDLGLSGNITLSTEEYINSDNDLRLNPTADLYLDDVNKLPLGGCLRENSTHVIIQHTCSI